MAEKFEKNVKQYFHQKEFFRQFFRKEKLESIPRRTFRTSETANFKKNLNYFSIHSSNFDIFVKSALTQVTNSFDIMCLSNN